MSFSIFSSRIGLPFWSRCTLTSGMSRSSDPFLNRFSRSSDASFHARCSAPRQRRRFRRTLQQRKRLAVRQPRRAANHRARKPHRLDAPAAREIDEHRVRQPVHLRLERADAVAQPLGQHRDHAVGEIHAVAARERFPVQRAARRDVMAHVRDVDAQPPPAAGQLLHADGVVEIARVVGVDRDDEIVRAGLRAAPASCVVHLLRESAPPPA